MFWRAAQEWCDIPWKTIHRANIGLETRSRVPEKETQIDNCVSGQRQKQREADDCKAQFAHADGFNFCVPRLEGTPGRFKHPCDSDKGTVPTHSLTSGSTNGSSEHAGHTVQQRKAVSFLRKTKSEFPTELSCRRSPHHAQRVPRLQVTRSGAAARWKNPLDLDDTGQEVARSTHD